MKNFFYGFLLGAALLAPGLSIATLALILGIYEKLLGSVSDFFSSRWKKTLSFLIPLGIGAVIAIGISSLVFTWAYDYFPVQTHLFLLGLIIASIPMLWKSSEAKTRFKASHFISLAGIALVIGILSFFEPAEISQLNHDLTVGNGILLFLTGILTAAATLLPGLSGALVLLLLGTHSLLIHALSSLNLPILGVTALGMLFGLIFLSKLISRLIENYLDWTNAISIGLVLGSIPVMIPVFSADIVELLTSAILFLLGFASVRFMDKK